MLKGFMAFSDIAPDTVPAGSHAAKRISILEAAAIAFCREGYAGANIDMIAAEAGVSRQTVYNHHGDKEKLFVAVVRALTDRTKGGVLATFDAFPDQPADLEAELIEFAFRLNRNFLCNGDGKYLRKLIKTEGERYPQLFAGWREDGPGRTWAALAVRLERLARSGHLDIDDADVAARQFLALVNADLDVPVALGDKPDEEQIREAATNAVRTFLRAYGKSATV